MTTAYTSLLGLALPVTGELSGQWGTMVDNAITSPIDVAVAGTQSITGDSNVTLTVTNGDTSGTNLSQVGAGTTGSAQYAVILCSGARTAQRTITVPAQSKIYTVINATTGGFSVKVVGSGPTTGVTILAGESAVIAWNGSDFIKISNTAGAATFTDVTISGNETLSGGTANGVAYLNGSKVVTTGSALTFDGSKLAIGTATSNIQLTTTVNTNQAYISLADADGRTAVFRGPNSGAPNCAQIGTTTNHETAFLYGGSEQMRLTSTGLGIGTSSPATKLHVKGGDGNQIRYEGTSNIYALGVTGGGLGYVGSLTNTNFSILTNVNTVATFDTSGNLGLGVTPSAWYSGTKAIQLTSAALTSTASTAYLYQNAYLDSSTVERYYATGYASKATLSSGGHQWYTAPSGTAGAAITFTQAMTLSAAGVWSLGDTGTVASSYAGVKFNGASYNGLGLNDSSSTSGVGFVYFQINGTTIGSITRVAATSAVAYNTVSDHRLKENIQDADSASELIDAIQVRKYEWKSDGTHQRYGFVAQELVTVAPEAVHQPADPEEMMAVDYSKLVPMLVKEIQSLRQRLAALEAK